MKYRIVTDSSYGFEAQAKRWWWPFWVQMGQGNFQCNSHLTVERAIEFIKRRHSQPPSISVTAAAMQKEQASLLEELKELKVQVQVLQQKEAKREVDAHLASIPVVADLNSKPKRGKK